MKYKLINNSVNDINDVIGTTLKNRGVTDINAYIYASEIDISDWQNLESIEDAIECFERCISIGGIISILSDTDVDGVCSTTILYKYLKELVPEADVRIIVHEKNKSHGLSKDFQIPEGTKLLICPDSGSNDIEEHKRLKESGITTICLDHHDITVSDIPDAIVVNNQCSPKYNSHECGAAITWQFCRALDDKNWTTYADKYIDLVAVANIADVISLKPVETRASVCHGLKYINNKMLLAIGEVQSFSMQGVWNPHTVAWYVASQINGFLRTATREERELLLRAFCEDESETFEYTKRGQTEPITESIYEHCVRLMSSYKGKQDRAKKKGFETIVKKINKQASDNKILIYDCTEELDQALTGLVAIALAQQYNKPTLLIRRQEEKPELFGGSGRAPDYCPIDNFREFVESCPFVNYANGHSAAFGVEIAAENVDKAIDWFNKQLQDVDFSKVYKVDFEVDVSEIDVGVCVEVDKHKSLWAKEIEEPLFAVTNISVQRKDIKVQGKDMNSIAFEVEGVKYVAFKLKEDNPLLAFANGWGDPDDELVFDAVVTCGINTYNGISQCQCMIEDVEVKTIQND